MKQNYQTVLSTALAAGKGPDIVHVRAYGNLETVASPGYLRPLTLDEIPDLKAFPPLSISAETMRSDSNLYAVPFASQTLVIYYNTDLFAEHGVTAPETWAEFIDASKTLKAAGVIPIANGTATAWQNEILVGTIVPNVPILTKVSQRACVLRFWGNDEDIGMHLAVSRGAGDAGRVGFWAEHAAEAGLAGTDRVAVG